MQRILVTWLLVSVALSGVRAEPPGSLEELRSLRDAYAGVESVYFEAARRAGDSPNQAQDVLTKIAVSHSDGRFGSYHFYPPQGDHLRASQIVHYDGHVLRELFGVGTYQEFTPGSEYFVFPNPVHQFFVPWAHVVEWVDLLMAQKDLAIDAADGVHRARSDSIGLSLEWEPPATLRAVQQLPTPTRPSIRIQLSDFGNPPASAFPIPKTFVQIIDTTMAVGNTSGVRARAVFDVVKLDINPPDIEDRLVFVPAKLGLTNRRDPATKNFYTPEGTFLYNEDDFLAAFDAAQRRKSRWHPMTIVTITIGTLLAVAIVLKRYKASPA